MKKLAKFLGRFYIVIMGLFISMGFIAEGEVLFDSIQYRKNLSDISMLFIITICVYIPLIPGYLLLLLSSENENTTSLNFFYYWFIGVTLLAILVT